MLILQNVLLVSFDAVVRLGTAHAAAKELGITQTAITQRIHALEAGLRLTLFIRSRRGMTLTEEGKTLLQHHRFIQSAEGDLIAKLTGTLKQDLSLTIIGPTSAISSRVAENCLPLYSKYPFLRLNLQSEDHKDLVEVLKRGEADLAIVHPSQVPNEVQSKLLKPDRYVLVAPSEWKGRDLKEILSQERIIDFYESDKTTINNLEEFNLLPYIRRNRLYVNQNEALIKLFQAGVGFGTLTESIAKPYLEEGSLIKLNRSQYFEEKLALVWYNRSKQLEYFEDVLRLIK